MYRRNGVPDHTAAAHVADVLDELQAIANTRSRLPPFNGTPDLRPAWTELASALEWAHSRTTPIRHSA